MRVGVITPLLLITVFLALEVRSGEKDEILFQKKEMERIRAEIEKSRKRLDSLKRSELEIQRRIVENDQKIAGNRKIVNRLNRELSQLKQEIKSTEANLGLQQLELDLSRRRHLGNIRQFYLSAHRPDDLFAEDPNEELMLHRQIVYLTAIAGFGSEYVEQAAEYLTETMGAMNQLHGERRKVTALKKMKETASQLASTARRKQQKDLEKLRRAKTEEADRVLTLEMAAREMEQIIARLQREEQQRRLGRGKVDIGPSIFASLKGQLLSPYEGKTITAFGRSVDPVTNLRSFSAGITIKGKAGQKVVAVASGAVAYVGSLRGYGKFVIIRHDDEYYTTYAGLGRTLVAENEYVLAGNKIAVSGDDGVMKFEVRHGREPLDPVKWIAIDTF